LIKSNAIVVIEAELIGMFTCLEKSFRKCPYNIDDCTESIV